jgi:hypothetical protein
MRTAHGRESIRIRTKKKLTQRRKGKTETRMWARVTGWGLWLISLAS